MNEAHRGKIGHLPKALQEDVNRRLEKGEHGRTVVAWLNALPEVQAVLAAEFAGQRDGLDLGLANPPATTPRSLVFVPLGAYASG